MNKILLFDVDGVLRNSEQAAHKGYRDALRVVGVKLKETPRATWRLRGQVEFNPRSTLLHALLALSKEGMTLQQIRKKSNWKQDLLKLAEKHRPSKEVTRKMNTAFSKTFGTEVIPPVKGVITALQKLKVDGKRMAILSDGHSESIQKWLVENGVTHLFEVVLGSNHVSRIKPAPDGILDACSKLGVKPADVTYIGDTPVDVLAAKAAGCRAISVLSGMATRKTIQEAKPHRIIRSLGELT